MQLDKVVAFHKALADPTRIRILFLLKDGPLHGQAIAGKLGLSAPTVTHHMARLRQISLIKGTRDKHTVYFELDRYFFEQNTKALLQALFDTKETDRQSEGDKMNQNDRLWHSVIANFFTKDGKLKQIPAHRKRKLIVFEHMIQELKIGEKYTEQQINEHILRFHEDYCTIRREFVINHFMYRDHGVYELNPRQMWDDWRTIGG